MSKISYSILVVGFFYLISCNPQPEATVLLKRAESIVEKNPDSAMLLIDSIYYPEKSLKRDAYMRFLVTQVRAKYKTYHPINEDTLIFKARDFFSKNDKDFHMAALAWFYSGCVYREREEYNDAMQHYDKAGDYAMQTGDFILQGLVQYNFGDLFAKQGLHEKALEQFMKAAQLNASEPGKQAHCLSAVGRMYFILEKPDSAFLYFHKGLELAETSGNKKIQSQSSQNLSVAYKHINQFDKAEKYLWQSFSLNTDSTEIPRYYLNFAELYAGIGQQDSAAIYTEKLQKCIDTAKDNNFKVSVYTYLAGWEKARANYDAAFVYQGACMKTLNRIMDMRNNQLVYEVHRKYDYEKMKYHHERRINLLQYWTIILLLAITVGGSSFSWYMFQQRKKHTHTQLQIEILRQIAVELNKDYEIKVSAKECDLRELLLWKFDIIKKSALLDEYSKSKLNAAEMVRIFQQILYQGNKSGHWQNILSVFDQMNKGVVEKIKSLFPGLSEMEYRIILLTYAGMSVRESSVILDLRPNTVQTYRTKLRKKIGIEDCTVDLESYLKEKLDNT